ncbi:MAG: hypothetical protein FWE17_01495 [Alphaproteobacteria bacterium]|nr:hypothetical protein [Alphaproteobacteria bacterium]MCL2758073.1 hypothetical protein [Alphaproteobacteria bacterium]
MKMPTTLSIAKALAILAKDELKEIKTVRDDARAKRRENSKGKDDVGNIWCNYNYSQKDKQKYNGQYVAYDSNNYTPGIQKFIKSVDKDFELIAVQVMTVHTDLRDVHGLQWGETVPRELIKYDSTENGRRAVGRIIVKYESKEYTSPVLALGSWSSVATASQLAALNFAVYMRWMGSPEEEKGTIVEFLENLVAQHGKPTRAKVLAGKQKNRRVKS